MPEKLARDLIYTYSNEEDNILDIYGGSGTTAKMAYLLNRNVVLCEINKEYYDKAIQRIKNHISQQRLF